MVRSLLLRQLILDPLKILSDALLILRWDGCIRPAAGLLLSLGSGGIGVNFAQRVNHPGTKPNEFPEEAMGAIEPFIVSEFADAMQEALVVE